MLLLSAAVVAVPAKRGVKKTLVLSDGTTVQAQLVGDEFGHYWVAADGKAYQEESGAGYYKLVNAQNINSSAQQRRAQVNEERTRRLAARRVGEVGNYAGKKRGIVILVNFSDTKFKPAHDKALFQRMANEEGFSWGDFKGSMYDYFKKQSLGQFELTFDVVGPVTVSKTSAYYGENSKDEQEEDLHPAEMVIEAVDLAKNEVTDWNQYDWDGDGWIDQVYIVYAGLAESGGGDANTIWPHAYSLYSAKYYGDGTGPVQVGKNLRVNTYACGSELADTDKIDGIGTMCHEFSHCLGYPDFYDTEYSGGNGMSYWDLMDQGCYNDDGYQPAGYTSYERWMAGWAEPTVLETDDVQVTEMGDLQTTAQSYVIYNKGNRNEFYLLENRQFTAWDASLPGCGLLILHVDYDQSIWNANKPNNDKDHQRMTWVAADNEYQTVVYDGEEYLSWMGLSTDTYPYKTNNTFSRMSSPAATFFNKNTDGTKFLDSSIEQITQNSNGTIAFKFIANKTAGIHHLSAVQTEQTPIYMLDGRYVGNNPSQLPLGVYIVNGKKIIKK